MRGLKVSTTTTAEVMTTKSEREIIRHSLFGSSGAKKPFRNYFCASVGGEYDAAITRLVGLGLMSRGRTINQGRDYYAYVTEAGAAEIGAKLPKD
jgi:hypothetical protein